MKILKLTTTTLLSLLLLGTSATASAAERTTGRGTGPVIYVTSQGLYYDSIVLADLPMKGEFQQLMPGTHGIETEYGPGDAGHLGGRWWLDINGDGIQNEGDKFFLCPLLGPGRDSL